MWTERVEDGRVRYGMGGLGLGLLIGSFTSAVDTAPRMIWTGFLVGSICLLGVGAGLALLAIALLWPWLDEEWALERRRNTARQHLAIKAYADPEFREELKVDPRQAFKREFGRTILGDSDITVVEETPQHRFVVLKPSLSHGPSESASRVAKWCECAWIERAEDGRVRYAVACFGLGLLVGSVLAIISDNAPLIDWTSFGLAPLSFLGFCVGIVLFLATMVSQDSSEQDWAWRRRDLGERLFARANCDPGFRDQLKADPRRVVEKFGGRVPDGFEFTVLEQTPTHQYIVLNRIRGDDDGTAAEVKASPPAGEEVGRAPAEAQGKPRPTGRFKRTLTAVADWDPPDSDFFEWVLKGVLVVLGIGALLLLSLFAPDVVNSVSDWLFSHDSNFAVEDLVVIGCVLLAAAGAILWRLWLAARWLAGKISARRAALAERTADRQGDMPRSCRADHGAGDEPGGGVDLAVTDRGSAERWAGWVAFAVLLGVALFLLRRRGDR
jgi:hypothetical protein